MDRISAMKDILRKERPGGDFKIVPEEDGPSAIFSVEKGSPDEFFLSKGSSRWKLSACISEKITEWLPNAKRDVYQVKGWMLVNFSAGGGEVVAVAVDGGPLFYEDR
ncbi:MAG TPA: hypothetical protein VIM57_11350 [Luteolibacter sp.]